MKKILLAATIGSAAMLGGCYDTGDQAVLDKLLNEKSTAEETAREAAEPIVAANRIFFMITATQSLKCSRLVLTPCIIHGTNIGQNPLPFPSLIRCDTKS